MRIDAFEAVRNIPYHIALNESETSANCVAKSRKLAKRLASLGLETREIICSFAWEESPLPADILALPRDHDETHLFLQVLIPESGNWVSVDPTWNPELSKLGFQIAEWNGLNDTNIAVKPHRIYSPEETVAKLRGYQSDPLGFEIHMQKHCAFYKSINEWLDMARVS